MSDKLIEAVAKRMMIEQFGTPFSTSIALARAALSAIEAEGFVVVPVEPTANMQGAGFRAIHETPEPRAKAVYTAMLSARPKVTP